MKCVSAFLLVVSSLAITACGGGKGSSPPPPPPPPPANHSVGGTVSGLAGAGLVLQLNSAGDLPVSADGSFTFVSPLPAGTNYSVTVRIQPSGPAQNCTVTNGSGIGIAANVSNVQISCTTNTFALGGSVTGLSGTGLVLTNAGVDLPITANGNFAFATALTPGTNYSVFVRGQPHGPVQRCAVTNGAGTIGSSAVNNVAVNCTTRYSRFAFAVNSAYDTVSRYIVNSSTGRLQPHGYESLAAQSQPIALAMTPDNRFALILNYGSNGSVGSFSMDAASGDLAPVQQPLPTGDAPFDVEVHPNGRFAYVANAGSANISAFSIDQNTGALTPLAGSPFPSGRGMRDLVFSAAGDLMLGVATDDDRLYSYAVDSATGALTLAPGGPAATGDLPVQVALDSTSMHAFVSNNNSQNVTAYSVDNTGRLTPITGSPFAVSSAGVVGLTLEPSGRFLYVANNAGLVTVFGIGASGALTERSTRTTILGNTINNPHHVSVDSTGKFLYVSASFTDRIISFSIDQSTGDLTPLTGMSEIVTSPGVGQLVMTQADSPAVIKPSGLFVASLGGGVSAFTVSATTGELTAAAGSPVTVPNITSPTPGSLATDLFGRSLYVGLVHQAQVSSFSIGAGAALASTGEVSTPLSPLGLAVDPSGRFVFATNENNTTVSQYVAAPGGSLVPQTNLTVPTNLRPFEMSIEETGRFAYIANYDGVVTQYAIDHVRGLLGSLGSATSGSGAVGIVAEPSGRFAYVTNDTDATVSAFSIHPATGALTQMGKVSAGLRPISVAADPTGRFVYVACFDANSVYGYSIDQVSGALTLMAGSPFATSAAPRSIAVDPSGKFLYTTDYNAAVVTIKSIDAATGALSPVGNMPVVAQPHDVVLTSQVD